MENKHVNWKQKWMDIVFPIRLFHSRFVSKLNSQLVFYIPFPFPTVSPSVNQGLWSCFQINSSGGKKKKKKQVDTQIAALWLQVLLPEKSQVDQPLINIITTCKSMKLKLI